MMAILTALLILCAPFAPQDSKAPKDTKKAMDPFRHFIGKWRGAGMPEPGSKLKAWEEEASWEYSIIKNDYSLKSGFKDGKLYKAWHLKYDKKKKIYRMFVTTAGGKKQTYEGKMKRRELTLVQVTVKGESAPDPEEKITFNLLHSNRYLVFVDRRAKGKKAWTTLTTLAYTKKGVPFVKGRPIPECIVTGGNATLTLSYKGKTYPIC